MSTETTNKKIKIDNGTTFGRTYTDKAIDAKLPTDLIASANKLSLGVDNAPLGNGINLSGFTYDEATKTLKAEGKSSVNTVDINITVEQYQNISQGIDVTLTDAQINEIKKSDYVRFVAERDGVIGTVSFYVTKNTVQSTDFNMIAFSLINAIGTKLVIGNFDNNTLKQALIFNIDQYIESISFSFGARPCFYINSIENNENITEQYTISEINGKSIISKNEWNNFQFIEDKTISLFGKHSILVPKNSADTAIDLYNHNIVLKDSADTTTKKIYLTVQSTTNTPVTTKELLQTLLGSTARYIRVSGYTSTNDISAINWTGTFDTSKYDVRGTETSLTDFTVIEDSVVTL